MALVPDITAVLVVCSEFSVLLLFPLLVCPSPSADINSEADTPGKPFVLNLSDGLFTLVRECLFGELMSSNYLGSR